MSWCELLSIIKAESPPEAAAKIEQRLLHELAGIRVAIPTKARLTDGDIQKALRENGYNVEKAAKALGVHSRTVYRRLQPRRQAAKREYVGPTMNGRIVR